MGDGRQLDTVSRFDDRAQDYVKLLGLLRALHTRYAEPDGCVTLVYDTELFLASRR